MEAFHTYDRCPTAAQVRNVRSAGVAVHEFDVLPMLGVRGTKTRRLLSLDGPDSIYAGRRLQYLLHQSVRAKALR